ncbi:transglutaminase-like protein, putative [Bodo saltans]|uniref:Transglutaminase-like protein, putative n=1 Tax=Bodo saltans TaxID=75058 RepID=A0A0S4IZ67_BODSA|nr:transglutaminase-like protein, putative [Bodo saltans]|eukprot:CUG63242.1 transglutaminase-like protein, putative [Bodo saltans]
MKSVVLSTYRKALAASSSFVTSEEQAIARTRFVEFLPPMFTLTDDNETLPNIVRRAYRYNYASNQETLKAVTAAFQFMKDASAEHSEVEVLAHWARISSRRRAAHVLRPEGGSEAAPKKAAPRKSSPMKPLAEDLDDMKDPASSAVSIPVWMDGVILISYSYQRNQHDAAANTSGAAVPSDGIAREHRDWLRHILWGQRPNYDVPSTSKTAVKSNGKKKAVGKQKKNHRIPKKSTTSPFMVLRKDAWAMQHLLGVNQVQKKDKSRVSSTSSSLSALGTGAVIEQESYALFKRDIAAQLDAIVAKVRASLVVEQIALLEENIRKKPKRPPVLPHTGVADIRNSSDGPFSESATDYFQKKITRKAVRMQKQLGANDNKEILAGITVETVVRGAIRVFLEDLKFSAITVSPLEGFLIDKVLETRVGSVSLLSILFASVLRTLGVQASVTMDQRCPMIKVEGFRDVVCFVNLADGGTILTSDEALEYHVKAIQSATHARTALKAADPRVVYCGILASMLVATTHSSNSASSSSSSSGDGTRSLLRAQLLYLSRAR